MAGGTRKNLNFVLQNAYGPPPVKNEFVQNINARVIIGLLLILNSCGSGNMEKQVELKTPEVTYQWIKLTDSALFPKSYNFQLFSIRDTLWAFHPEGNYFSTDGREWTRSVLPNSIYNLAFLDYIEFNQGVYGLGYLKGNIEQFQFKPQITATQDMKQWKILADRTNLPPRFFYHPFIFDQKIWIVGGMDKSKSFSDIWNSPDALQWQQVKDNAPFGPRQNSNIIHFKNKLFLLNNDVWSSADGINWKRETSQLVRGEDIFGYAAVVYDDQIWLLGCSRNGKFNSKVLHSRDGIQWMESDAPWSPRGGVAACVHKGRIVMTGGKFGGLDISNPDFEYSNDVWAMEKVETPGKKSVTTVARR